MPLSCAIAVVGWALAGGAVQAEAFPFPPHNGKLVLVSDRGSVDANGDSVIQDSERNRDVYAINPDGSGLQRLTNGPRDRHQADRLPGRSLDRIHQRPGRRRGPLHDEVRRQQSRRG